MIAPARNKLASEPETDKQPIQVPSWLLLLLLIVFAWHGIVGFLAPDHELTPDETEYLALAEALAKGGDFLLPSGDRAKRMPLYPWLIAQMRGDQEVSTWKSSIDLLQSGLAALATIGFALAAAALGGTRAGLLAGLIAALYAPFAFLQTQYLTETLTVALFAAALAIYLWFGVVDRGAARRRYAAYMCVSILLGLATLARANMAVMLIPFALDVLLRQRGSARVGGLVALMLPATLMLGSWANRNQQAVGKFTLSTIGGLNFYLGNNSDYAADAGVATADYQRFDRLRAKGMSELEADAALYAEGWSFIRQHSGTAFTNLGRKIVTFFYPTTQRFSPLLIFLVVALPAYALWLNRKQPPVGEPVLPDWIGPVVYLALAATTAGLAYWMFDHYRSPAQADGVGLPPPYISPHYLLPVGLMALLLAKFPYRSRGVLIGLLLVQLAVALVFIPLSRIRWTVDGVLIVALAVAVAQLCEFLCGAQPTDEATESKKSGP